MRFAFSATFEQQRSFHQPVQPRLDLLGLRIDLRPAEPTAGVFRQRTRRDPFASQAFAIVPTGSRRDLASLPLADRGDQLCQGQALLRHFLQVVSVERQRFILIKSIYRGYCDGRAADGLILCTASLENVPKSSGSCGMRSKKYALI